MIINIVLFVCFFPVALILYFVMRNEAKPKKNLILGVTLPHDARQDPSVQAVVKNFLVQQTIILAGLILLLVPQFLMNRVSVTMLWIFIWMIAAILLPGIPYITANKKLKALKASNNWYGESTGVTLIDTKLAVTRKKPISVWWFISAVVVSLLPVIHTIVTLRGHDEFWPMLIVYLSFFALCAASWFLYKTIFRQRAEVVDGNTAVSAALTQIRRYNWGKTWILITWLTAIFVIAFWLAGFNSAAFIILTVAYTTVLLAFVMQAEFKTRKMQQKLTAESGKDVYTDDDDKWLFGMFYNNTNDEHNFVSKRTGIGLTMNLAKAPGKILIVFTVLILLSMPGIGIWLMQEESAAVSLSVTGTQLTASHTGTVYDLDIGSITVARMIDVLPSGGIRTNGTAMSTVLKGNFRYDGIGSCRLCLNPQVPPFLVVDTAGDGIYIFGSHDSGETRAIFEKLQSAGVPTGSP